MAPGVGRANWRLGVAGLGVAGSAIVRAARDLAPWVTVTRAADPDEAARLRWSAPEGLNVSPSVDELCDAPDVDVIYVASPTPLHREHAERAIRAGKHVMVEKPLASTLTECDSLIAAAREGDAILICAHTPSLTSPLITMRSIIDSGRAGAPLHSLHVKYVPWLRRPRLAAELDPALGGGVVPRQAPHLIDAALYLLPSQPTTVHAVVGQHSGQPHVDGNFTALVRCASGEAATLVFNGYGYFDSAVLTGNVGEDGYRRLPGAGQRLYRSRGASKEDMRAGLTGEFERGYTGSGERYAPMNGWILVSCEDADLLQTPYGVRIFHRDAVADEPLLPSRGHLAESFHELDAALEGKKPVLHDGLWGRRVVQIAQAIQESSGSQITVAL